MITAQQALPDTIDLGNLEIEWKIEQTIGTDTATKTYGKSQNRAYVTGAAAPNAFETVLDIGCRNAKGKRPHNPNEAEPDASNHDREVVDAVWAEFADNSVVRVSNSVEMLYNHDADTTYSAADMLNHANGKGQCTAWADLLIVSLTAQGIGASTSDIKSTFTVKVRPAQGSQNQGYMTGTNRMSFFQFHQVVRIWSYADRIYDPSYGTYAEATGTDSVEVVYEDNNIVEIWNGTAWAQQTQHVLDLLFL